MPKLHSPVQRPKTKSLYSLLTGHRPLFGFTEFASRLPSALAYVGTVLATFLLALELVGSGTAPLAALIYATSLGPFLFGRFLFTDTLLVFWLSVSLLGLAKIIRRPETFAGPVLFYLGASLAGLTKGLIGLLFPFATAAAYAFFLGGRGFVILSPSLIVAGIGLTVAPIVFFSAKRGSAALTGLVSNLDGYYREYFASHPGAAMVFGTELLRMARPFPIVLLVLGVTTFLALRMARRRHAFALWVAGTVLVLGLADGGMRLVAEDRSQRAAAAIVDRDWAPGARLVVAEDYEEGCGITFYTGRVTQVFGGPGPELLFGYRRGDAPELFLTPDAFLAEWESSDRVFVLGGRDLTLPGATVLLEGPRCRLLLHSPCEATEDSRAFPVADGARPHTSRAAASAIPVNAFGDIRPLGTLGSVLRWCITCAAPASHEGLPVIAEVGTEGKAFYRDPAVETAPRQTSGKPLTGKG